PSASQCAPVRRNVAPASANSSIPLLPSGVFASGGGGVVKPIGNTFLPSITNTWSELMVTLLATAPNAVQRKAVSKRNGSALDVNRRSFNDGIIISENGSHNRRFVAAEVTRL